MPELLFIILFIICLGAATGAIMLVYQMNRDYRSEFINQFFYYLMAYFVFGLYGLWGQVIVRYLLERLNINSSAIETVGGLVPLFGIPFLLITWLMLIKMAVGLTGKNISPLQSLSYFLGTTALLAAIGWIINNRENLTQTELYLFAGAELLFYFVFLLISLTSSGKINSHFGNIYRYFSLLVFLGMILRLILLPFIFVHFTIQGGALLLYFLGNLLPVWYLRSKADILFPSYTTKIHDKNILERFCERHGITKREVEVIQLICQGKTNQEISDTLYIGLQTVKDHNHRIYTKIGIHSRVQLINLLNSPGPF